MKLSLVKCFFVVCLMLVILVLGIDSGHKNKTITQLRTSIQQTNLQIEQNNAVIDSLRLEDRYITMRDLIEQLQEIDAIAVR